MRQIVTRDSTSDMADGSHRDLACFVTPWHVYRGEKDSGSTAVTRRVHLLDLAGIRRASQDCYAPIFLTGSDEHLDDSPLIILCKPGMIRVWHASKTYTLQNVECAYPAMLLGVAYIIAGCRATIRSSGKPPDTVLRLGRLV